MRPHNTGIYHTVQVGEELSQEEWALERGTKHNLRRLDTDTAMVVDRGRAPLSSGEWAPHPWLCGFVSMRGLTERHANSQSCLSRLGFYLLIN